MDSTQAYFCRDLWVDAAKDTGLRGTAGKDAPPGPWAAGAHYDDVDISTSASKEVESEPFTLKQDEAFKEEQAKAKDEKIEDDLISNKDDEPFAEPAPGPAAKNRPKAIARQAGAADAVAEVAAIARLKPGAQHKGGPDTDDADANAGSDFDAMADDADVPPPPLEQPPANHWTVPNSDFNPARILVNPRCVTTYAGVSHAQLALDLFGPDKEEDAPEYTKNGGKYVLEDWEGAPDTFVCQEQKQTGGRKAIKTQRRLSFSISEELARRADAQQQRTSP